MCKKCGSVNIYDLNLGKLHVRICVQCDGRIAVETSFDRIKHIS